MKMQNLAIVFCAAFFCCAALANADCKGCCSGHGGVVCKNAKTLCADGTALSENCVSKNCDKCGGQSASTPEHAQEKNQGAKKSAAKSTAQKSEAKSSGAAKALGRAQNLNPRK